MTSSLKFENKKLQDDFDKMSRIIEDA